MEKLSPANLALITRMQNNQTQAQVPAPKASELPNDTVELSTSVKKPKNKAAMIIGGLVAGAAIAASLIVAYKKGVFFKLEGAMLKKEADKAYQKAQVVADEVMELINKGLNEGLEEFTDEKTGRTVKMFSNRIEEYNGDSLAREARFDLIDDVINIKQIHIHKKGKLNTEIDFLPGNKIDSIGKGITYDENCNNAKISRIFGYSENMHGKNCNFKNNTMKCFGYDPDGKVTNYAKQTKTHSTEWSQEDGLKREKLIRPEIDIELEEEEIIVEEAIPTDNIIITASEEDFAE